MAGCDGIIVIIQQWLTFGVGNLVEDDILVDDRRIQVDDDVTFHMTAVIAATIDVTALETTVTIFWGSSTCRCIFGHLNLGVTDKGIPL